MATTEIRVETLRKLAACASPVKRRSHCDTPDLCILQPYTYVLHVYISQRLVLKMTKAQAGAYEEPFITQAQFGVCQHGLRFSRSFRDRSFVALLTGTGRVDSIKVFRQWCMLQLVYADCVSSCTHARSTQTTRDLAVLRQPCPLSSPPLNARPTGT